MEKTIGILGGDLRSVELARILREKGLNIGTYALLDNEVSDFESFLNDG